MHIDELRARQAEITNRLQGIHNEYGADLLPDEIRAEWDNLVRERDLNDARIQQYEQRNRVVEAIVRGNPNALEEGSLGGFGGSGGVSHLTGGRRGPSNVFAVEEYRAHYGSNPEQLRMGFHDGAMRAVETATFPHEGVKRAEAQEHIARLLERDSKDSEIALRILTTGSRLYARAFVKAISGQMLNEQERTALNIAAGAQGAYAVPYNLDPTVINVFNGVVNPIRAIARLITIAGSNQWKGVSSEGVVAAYDGEGVEATDNAPTFDQPVIDVEIAKAFIPYSFEIEGDFGGLLAELARMLAEAKDTLEANKFLHGLGHASKEPLGIIQTLSTTPASVVTSSAINSFGAVDIYGMEEDLGPRFRPLAEWIGARAIYNKIRGFGNGGNEADLWVRDLQAGLANNRVGNTGARLLDYPANEASEMVGVLDGGNEILVLGDWRHFAVVDRVGMNIEQVQHLFGAARRMPTGQRGMLAWWRNSSGCLAPEAFRLLVCASS